MCVVPIHAVHGEVRVWGDANKAELEAAVASFKARFGLNGERYRHYAPPRQQQSAAGGGCRFSPSLAKVLEGVGPAAGSREHAYQLEIRISTRMWLDRMPILSLLGLERTHTLRRRVAPVPAALIVRQPVWC